MTELFAPIPPFLIYLVGALLVPLLHGPARKVFALAIPLFALLNYFQIQTGLHWQLDLQGFQVVFGRADKWSLVFLNIFTVLSFIGILYNLKDNRALDLSAGLLYSGAAMGVVMAGDLLSMFLFWEMLTIGATLCLLARGTERSGAAAIRYFVLHVMGGVVLLAGVLMHYSETGSLAFEEIGLGHVSTYLIFFGFGLNCAWPVLGAWLTDTYPEASIGGIVFMATFTTKTAVYVLARTFPGQPELVWIGMAMAILPLFYTVIENDLRRVLAYALINQVGFMVVGIGLGTDLALNGTAAHAYCHILYKSLLFMSIGAVMYRTGKAKATELGGLYKSMPWTCLFCCIGALSMSAPLFCGFVSKSMIMSAAAASAKVHPEHIAVWLALLFATAAVFQSAGIKVPFFTFFSRDSGIRCKEAPWNMMLAMALTAILCIVVGSRPTLFLYPMLPEDATYVPYTAAHVSDQLGLLLFSGLAFALLILAGVYPANVRSTNIDADWDYRRGGRAFYWTMDHGLNGANRFLGSVVTGLINGVKAVPKWLPYVLAWIFLYPYWKVLKRCTHAEMREHLQSLEGQTNTGTWPIGLTACFSVLLLAILFIFS